MSPLGKPYPKGFSGENPLRRGLARPDPAQ
jgi:hypothetical protein